MILIIAEKPSLARNIVAGIGSLNKKNGYFDGMGYLVTWAFGHLFSLYDIEDYGAAEDGAALENHDVSDGAAPQKQYWSMDNIPCFPEKFLFKLRADKSSGSTDKGVEKQFEIIRNLCRRDDVDTIVNAGDADREGEIIVRLCIENALDGITDKKLMRLWLPDQTPETVRNALAELKSESEYNNLANEGFARTYIDWLYGVNLTRFATIKTGTLLRVGRVIVPIVKAIYDRDVSIRNFVPDTYYAISSNEETGGEKVELISKNKFEKKDLEKAKQLCEKYNAAAAIVKSKKVRKDTVRPGKLYSLSKLQNVLGKKYKMPMEKSLAIVQKLYEEGFLTYPRTNSEYLAAAEKDKISKILENVKALGYDVEFKDGKTIFDDSKIESHSAITPTYKIPSKDKLAADEYTVYSTVMRRFAAVFCAAPCLAEKTEIVIDVGGYEEFTLKGTVIIEKGWTKYDDYNQRDKILPKLNKGDSVNICFKPAEKETVPPKHYTIETLNNYLKNPFREEKANAAKEESGAQNTGGEDESDDIDDYRAVFEGLELGTEATRTGIINNAITSKYIALKKDVYTILPGGEFLIESLGRMNISMDKYKTSEMGQALKKVYKGNMSVEESVEIAKREIGDVFKKKKVRPEIDTDNGIMGQVIGKCPYCGENFVRTKFGYGCSGYKNGCKFSVSAVICGRVISVSNMKLALENGKTSRIEGFVSKNGKSFDATMKLENRKLVFDF